MPTAHLIDRALVAVSGAEAEHFLQNILTTDLDALPEKEARPGALLSPQGKILFDFLISRINGGGGFGLDCRADVADDFVRRLMFYRLRAKIEIRKREQEVVAVSWRDESASSSSDSTSLSAESGVFHDRRFPAEATVNRQYNDVPEPSTDVATWNAFRIDSGIAESGSDFTLGDAFPHDILLDQMGGIGFAKGCYVGQEVVSRMQHRGTTRRRVLIAEAATDGLAPSAPITADGRALGNLGSVSGRKGLAIVRIDRVKDATDAETTIEAGGVPIRLSIPDWAKFTFPAGAPADDA